MDDIPDSREFDDDDLTAVVAAAAGEWSLREATVVDRGFCTIYELTLVSGGDTRTCYLKSSPDGKAWSIPDEVRLQAVLADRTEIPVAEVLWAVDDHDSLPTPSFLMDAMPGDALPYEHVGEFDDDTLRRLARDTGEHLGELHSLPAPDGFGNLSDEGPPLRGERPSGDPAMLGVEPGLESWSEAFEGRVGYELGRLEDSWFSDLEPDLRPWFDARVDELAARDDPFESVFGRNDHGLHNLLVDPETGAVTAVLDWAYTLVVPPAFDVEYAIYLYSGAFLAGLDDVEDRRPLVREAMLRGYRETAPALFDRVASPEPAYELLAMTRIMNDFHHLDLTEGTEDAVMNRIREDARAVFD